MDPNIRGHETLKDITNDYLNFERNEEGRTALHTPGEPNKEKINKVEQKKEDNANKNNVNDSNVNILSDNNDSDNNCSGGNDSANNFGVDHDSVSNNIKDSSNKSSVNNDSANKDSVNNDSANKDSVNNDSANKDSVNNDSANKDSVNNDSANKDSVNNDSANKDSVNNDSANKDSDNNDSANKDSDNNDSANKDSVNNDSANKDSVNNHSANKDSVNNDSANKDSDNKDSANKDSVNNDSANKDSVNNDSANNNSVCNDSTNKDSVSKDSANNPSANNDSVKNDSANKDTANNDSNNSDDDKIASVSNDTANNVIASKDSVNDIRNNDGVYKDSVNTGSVGKDNTSNGIASSYSVNNDSVSILSSNDSVNSDSDGSDSFSNASVGRDTTSNDSFNIEHDKSVNKDMVYNELVDNGHAIIVSVNSDSVNDITNNVSVNSVNDDSVDNDNASNSNGNSDSVNNVTYNANAFLEEEMLTHLFNIRKKILTMGTDMWIAKFHSNTEYANTRSEILRLVNEAEEKINENDYENANTYLQEAEAKYSDVQRNISDEFMRSDSTDERGTVGTASGNQASGPNTANERQTVVSYEVTVPVDEHDIHKWISLGKKALDSGNLDKAKRLLLKAQKYMPTQNAEGLLRQVEAVRRARETPVQTPPVPVREELTEQSNFDRRDGCLAKVKLAMGMKNYEKAKEFLMEAQTFDPEFNVESVLNMVEQTIWQNKKKDILMKFAQEAVTNKNYEEAKTYLDEVRLLDPNVNIHQLVQEVHRLLEVQRKVKFVLELAKKCVDKRNFEGTELFLREAKNMDPDADTLDLWFSVRTALLTQGAIKTAEEAILAKDFVKAEEILQSIKENDTEADVGVMWATVQDGLRSATEPKSKESGRDAQERGLIAAAVILGAAAFITSYVLLRA